MSDVVLDTARYLPSPMTDWYRERSFKVAFAVSVVIHAALIAFLPGFRSVSIEMPRVLDVEIVTMQAPALPSLQEEPIVTPKTVERKVEPVPEPVVRQPPHEPIPEPVARPPRPEPKPEPVVRQPLPEPAPEPVLQQSQPEPAPIARVEPRPEPRMEPAEVRQEVRAPAPEVPAPVVLPRVEPPVVAPQPKAVDESRERTLIEQYRQTISARIKQYEEYPLVAKRRQWQGTTVVQLRLTAEGKVADISVVEKSGYEILDEAAVKMIRRASPLPLPPEGLRGRDHTVLVPIRFRLDS